MIITTAFGAAHLAAALAALTFGSLVMFMRKGTQLHRAIGTGYAASMVALNLAAFGIYRLSGHFGPFHALALVSLASVTIGVGAAMLRPRDWLSIHYRAMTMSYLGLLAATVAEIAIRVPALHVNNPLRGTVVGVASGVVFAVAGAIILPRLQRRAFATIAAD